MPEYYPDFDPQELKLLFMLLAENRDNINFYQHMTPYGIALLDSIRSKLGEAVVGVSLPLGERPTADLCNQCHQPVLHVQPN